MSVVILDYGLGNLKSLSWALERIGCKHSVTSDYNAISSSKKLIIPGVGSFGQAKKNLDNLDLTDVIRKYANDESNRILGICLGMQLLFEGSDESPGVEGLSLLQGTFRKLDDTHARVPHMGWNNFEVSEGDMNFKYLSDVNKINDYYFVHSYALSCETPYKSAKTLHGLQYFTSYVEHENVVCAQFHPEKSHLAGLTLLKNWIAS